MDQKMDVVLTIVGLAIVVIFVIVGLNILSGVKEPLVSKQTTTTTSTTTTTPTSSSNSTPSTSSSTSTRTTSTTRSSAIDHAKVLVWKHLGEPRYDVLSITRASNTVADVWDVSGRFAYVGSAAQSFDAIVEKQQNGDWWLLGFSW